MNYLKNVYLGLYEKSMPNELDIAQKLKIAKENNYDFLELSIDESDEKLKRLDMTKDERLEIIKNMYKYDIRIESICLSAHRKYPLGGENPEKSLEIMEKAIILAKDLGIRLIQIAGYDVYYTKSTKETEKKFIQNLEKSVDIASKNGVILGFETMETPFLNTVEKAMKYVNIVNSPYLGVYADSGNITNANNTYKTSVIDDIKLAKGHMFAVHLKEAKEGIFREVPFGKGIVDFDKIIEVCYEIGIRRFVTEFWCVDKNTYLEQIKSTKEFMDNKFNTIIKK